MTDEEVEKGLRCCMQDQGCNSCPFERSKKCDKMPKIALDYIARLKAEIASLREEAEDNVALAIAHKLRADKLKEEKYRSDQNLKQCENGYKSELLTANKRYRSLQKENERIRKETAKEVYELMTGEFEPYIDVEIAKEIADRLGATSERLEAENKVPEKDTDDWDAYRAAIESV